MKTKLEVLKDKKDRYKFQGILTGATAIASIVGSIMSGYEKIGGTIFIEYTPSITTMFLLAMSWYSSQRYQDIKSEIEMESL